MEARAPYKRKQLGKELELWQFMRVDRSLYTFIAVLREQTTRVIL